MIGNGPRPAWESTHTSRLGVLVIIQVIIVVLMVMGSSPQTALAIAGGGGMAAAQVARLLFPAPSRTTRPRRRETTR